MNDAHEDLGRMIWGDEAYDSDPQKYRQRAKISRHALIINPDFVLDSLVGTESQIRADERGRISDLLRNMVTTDDGKTVAQFVNVANWLDGLD